MANSAFKTITHTAELCIIGGGLAGICAAISAARHNVKVVLMQDRPMFGGNASSEVRMWVCGAHGDNNRETGIIEEIMLENLHCNPYRKFPMWDATLFGIVKQEKNIDVILNCSCNDARVKNNKIIEVEGWQTTTQTFHKVFALTYADCSGDSVLAPLIGAEYRAGREARAEFNESIAPIDADKRTMGLTCLMQASETTHSCEFIAPSWAHKYTHRDIEHRFPEFPGAGENFWYLEIGGMDDSIADTEDLRDELLKMAYGYWDFIKNSGEFDASKWQLDFVGFLPGKRESRRYVGEYILNQNDVAAGGRFDDIIAYGGWTMDDHNPGGFYSREPATVFHTAPSPFGIPYRCVYSKNITNLFFAGRNISATHSAMSATRVMATCATLGQAVGTAASLCVKYSTTPHNIYVEHIDELKQTLMHDDCYLPYNKMEFSTIMQEAKITSDGTNEQNLINGYNRKIGNEDNCWSGRVGDTINVVFDKLYKINELRLVLDSDLNRETTTKDNFQTNKATLSMWHADLQPTNMPKTLIKAFDIEYVKGGKTIATKTVTSNKQRLVIVSYQCECDSIKINLKESYGNDVVNIFSIDIN